MLAEWFRRRGTGRRSSNHAAGTMYYNEVVMERAALQRGLPQGSIEAVYYVLLESCQQLAAAAGRAYPEQASNVPRPAGHGAGHIPGG